MSIFFRLPVVQRPLPKYQKLGYGSYQEYILSPAWAETVAYFKRRRPMSIYCFVCFEKNRLNLHHEDYTNLGRENIWKDLIYMCEDHHHMIHAGLPSLFREHLVARRLALRQKYIYRLFLHFHWYTVFKQWIFRKFCDNYTVNTILWIKNGIFSR